MEACDVVADNKKKPFALRFAERVETVTTPRQPGSELFDDPTTVNYTQTGRDLDEDPGTDEG